MGEAYIDTKTNLQGRDVHVAGTTVSMLCCPRPDDIAHGYLQLLHYFVLGPLRCVGGAAGRCTAAGTII